MRKAVVMNSDCKKTDNKQKNKKQKPGLLPFSSMHTLSLGDTSPSGGLNAI